VREAPFAVPRALCRFLNFGDKLERVMKTRLLLGILLASLAIPACAQTTPSPSPVGQEAKRWVVPRHLWMNTPKPIWLGGLQGHIVVVDFFRILCIHCEDSAPSRRALFEKFSPQGVKMVGFQSAGLYLDPKNPENDWAQVQATVKRWGLPYPIAFDEKSQLFRSYNFGFYPTVLVLDSKGVVRFYQSGYTAKKQQELEQAVSTLVEEERHAKQTLTSSVAR